MSPKLLINKFPIQRKIKNKSFFSLSLTSYPPRIDDFSKDRMLHRKCLELQVDI